MNSRSKKNELKEKHEEDILNLAAPNLQGIYGNYVTCENQKDKPDKAIILLDPDRKLVRGWSKVPKIGIEITTADPREYLAYMNDRKSDREIRHAILEETITSRIAPQSPLKSIDNKIHRDWIYRGIKDKAKKHQNYADTGEFIELVLLCYSEVIDTTNILYHDGLKDWTEYLLGQDNFPFDRVLFIGGDNVCEQIYKKARKAKSKPTPYKYEGGTITSTTVTVATDVTFNFDKVMNAEPSIKPEHPIVDRRIESSKDERTK